jgi:hypothetical protein
MNLIATSHKRKIAVMIFSFFTAIIFSQNFTTISFNAKIDKTQTPKAEVESAIDSNGNIHIAWIKYEASRKKVMYTFYNVTSKEVTTYEADSGFEADSKLLGDIVTLNNKPYIAFLCKRDKKAGTRNGNFAVMLLSNFDAVTGFKVEQVSTNLINPHEKKDDLFSSYVNGRPTIHFSKNKLIVSYLACANSKTSWDKFIIYAVKNKSGWSYNQEINTDDLGATYNVSGGMSIAKDVNYEYKSFIEISDYTIRYMYKSNSSWSQVEVGGYGSVYGNKHAQLITDDDNKTHLFWYNTKNEKFCHTILNGAKYGEIDEYKNTHKVSGNFMPATIDTSLKTPAYHYQRAYDKDEHIVVFKKDGSSKNYTIPDSEIGKPYGKRSLFAKNGKIYLVTASKKSNKIYITSN